MFCADISRSLFATAVGLGVTFVAVFTWFEGVSLSFNLAATIGFRVAFVAVFTSSSVGRSNLFTAVGFGIVVLPGGASLIRDGNLGGGSFDFLTAIGERIAVFASRTWLELGLRR